MKEIAERITGLAGSIEQIMHISGTAGLALGVIQRGRILYSSGFGFRDAEKKLPVDDKTVFPGASLTKAVVSEGMGILVEEKALDWSTPIQQILPDFRTQSKTLAELTTVTDLLAHRTGMQTSNYWLGSQNNILIRLEDSMKFLNNQKLVKPFRGQWQYNNLGYEIAGHVIEKLSGGLWSDLLHKRILEPLGMERTAFREGFLGDDENVAKAYGTLDDGKPVLIDSVKAGDNRFGGANGGIRTCVSDLLAMYKSLLAAASHQFSTGKTATPGSPFKQVGELLSSKIPLTPISLREQSYAFGWARVQLPGTMGAVGLNPKLMPDGMPVVAKGSPSQLAFYHQGSLPGALAVVILLPSTETAIVVMTNSLALNDCADWIGQMVLETLLDVKDKNDYVEMATKSVEAARSWYPDLAKELQAEMSGDPPPRDLSSYAGLYSNSINTMMIKVYVEGGKLHLAFQGLDSEAYLLTYLNNEVFTWAVPRNELAARGRFTHQKALYYKIRFFANEKNVIHKLAWTHDADVPEGEDFLRKDI